MRRASGTIRWAVERALSVQSCVSELSLDIRRGRNERLSELRLARISKLGALQCLKRRGLAENHPERIKLWSRKSVGPSTIITSTLVTARNTVQSEAAGRDSQVRPDSCYLVLPRSRGAMASLNLHSETAVLSWPDGGTKRRPFTSPAHDFQCEGFRQH